MTLIDAPALRPDSLRSKPGHHSIPQQFVLFPATPWRIRVPYNHLATDHDLLRKELAPGQIHLDSRPEPIPPVMTGLLAADADLAEHQLPAEKILDH